MASSGIQQWGLKQKSVSSTKAVEASFYTSRPPGPCAWKCHPQTSNTTEQHLSITQEGAHCKQSRAQLQTNWTRGTFQQDPLVTPMFVPFEKRGSRGISPMCEKCKHSPACDITRKKKKSHVPHGELSIPQLTKMKVFSDLSNRNCPCISRLPASLVILRCSVWLLRAKKASLQTHVLLCSAWKSGPRSSGI